jgi:IPT/TIG domain
MYRHQQVVAGFVAAVGLGLGCDGSSPSGPSSPLTPGPSAARGLAITELSPTEGSTGGGTIVRITGSGFEGGSTVTVDGERRAALGITSTTIQVTTQAHAAGAVDVVVTNPGGQTTRLAAGYAFAPPQSFAINGRWAGKALAHPETAGVARGTHSDMDIGFRIEGNALVSVYCSESAGLTLSPAPQVLNGEFSLVAAGVELTGRILSAASASGTINTPDCPATRWAATKQ